MTDDERDARIDTLIDAIADTNRNLGARIDQLATQMAKLTDLFDRHLRHDHGYGSDDDDD